MARRDPRDFVEVSLPFSLERGESRIEGLRLSLCYLTLREPLPECPGEAGREVTMRVPLNGFDLTLPMQLEIVATDATGATGHRYRILSIDPKGQATLARLLRLVLTGMLPGAADLLEEHDPPTPFTGSPAGKTARALPWVVLVLSLFALAGGAWVATHRAYTAFTTLTSTSATMTAPRVDIKSPVFGTVSSSVQTGAELSRDESVVTLRSAQLDADIQIAGANQRLFAVLALRAAGQSAESLSVVLPDGYHREMSKSEISLARDVGEARLQAFVQQRAALSFHSPCSCRLVWIAASGTSVAPGDLVATLVNTAPSMVTVEAQFSDSVAALVRLNQQASVTMEAEGRQFTARVSAIGTGVYGDRIGAQRARAGFVTVQLLLDDPNIEVDAGRPVRVVLAR
ncbi:hypothetical protein HYN69_02900 [Gemmobacter aquarius]|uniref:HlyD family secretion protein n=1 Tax=Paragemmobacter aquarius TaxID=2169400 RepID=A0A2S0UIF0_9RHOB|nr:hypothetical protein [Gemmobacter aquarius]AWB47593.1 hypothetical protein HYN69_02900 [Gemmobacter aquarius]